MSPKLTAEQRRDLVLRVARKKTSVTQACREAGISRTVFYRWLKKYRSRGIFEPGQAGRPVKPRSQRKTTCSNTTRLSDERKTCLVTDYLREKVSPDEISKKYRVSRQTVYYWVKKFLDREEGLDLTDINQNTKWSKKNNKNVQLKKRVPPEYERVVLEAVRLYPELGVDQLVEVLPSIGGRPLIGRHGVQNVLERRDLNTYQKRFLFANANKSNVEKIIGLFLSQAKLFFELGSQLRIDMSRVIGLSGGFVFGLVTALGMRAYFRLALFNGTISYAVGFLLASVGLFFGMVFFAYSLRYYLTLALVLSFSRDREGQSDSVLKQRKSLAELGLKRWLARVVGVEMPVDQKIQEASDHRILGLNPDLTNISLERQPFVSVHLPMYNEKRVAERIIKACAQMDYETTSGEAGFEIVVCDDSTDETKQIVVQFAKRWNRVRRKNQPKIIISHRQSRTGFKGGALQKALDLMNPKTEFIAVFDADFVPYPDTLIQFVKHFKAAVGNEDYQSSKVAVVGGYQWHVLNKSENWLTRGVRTEYAGSYVVERSGREIAGFLKQISGSVYLARADLIKRIGWGSSITEDFEMTLKLYERGYKVVYTPYVQAPAECVSTLKRLIRQRMRWAEGHSNNIKKMFGLLMWGHRVRSAGRWRRIPSALTTAEKVEVIYLSTYYLQAFFFLLGTLAWLLAEAVFRVQLPFWTALWGWSLILTNMLALPLVNAVGLFLEEAEEADYLGLLSFFVTTYLIVPFQAYASIKGFLEKDEGDWFRTPKTGRITDVFRRGTFYRFITGLLPGWHRVSTVAENYLSRGFESSPALVLVNANGLAEVKCSRRRNNWGKLVLGVVLLISVTLFSLSRQLSVVEASTVNYFYLATATADEDSSSVSGLYYGGTWQKQGSVVGGTNTSLGSSGDHYFYSREYPTGADDATINAGTFTANLYKINKGTGAVTVYSGNVSVGYCTGGCDEAGDYITLGTSSNISWTRGDNAGLYSYTIVTTDSPIVFTTANPGRIWTNLYATYSPNSSYSPGYNGSTADYISNLQLPTLTVPELVWVMLPVVLMVPWLVCRKMSLAEVDASE